jgi:hypothetical protein
MKLLYFIFSSMALPAEMVMRSHLGIKHLSKSKLLSGIIPALFFSGLVGFLIGTPLSNTFG